VVLNSRCISVYSCVSIEALYIKAQAAIESMQDNLCSSSPSYLVKHTIQLHPDEPVLSKQIFDHLKVKMSSRFFGLNMVIMRYPHIHT